MRDRLLEQLAALGRTDAERLALLVPDGEPLDELEALAQRGRDSRLVRSQAVADLAARGVWVLPVLAERLESDDGLEAAAVATAIAAIAPADGVTEDDLRWLLWRLDVPARLVELVSRADGDHANHARWAAHLALLDVLGPPPTLTCSSFGQRERASYSEACEGEAWRAWYATRSAAEAEAQRARGARRDELLAALEEVRQGRRPARSACRQR